MEANSRRLQLTSCLVFGAVLIFGFSVLAHSSQKKNGSGATQGVFTEDKGKFTIKLDGQTVGHEDFEISPSGGGWLAKGSANIKASEKAVSKITGSLTLQPDGAPISYEWTSQAEKTNGARILFTNGVAKMTLIMQGANPFDQTFTFNTPLIAVLDNNLYYQYAVLVRLYDWSKRGSQSFPVLIPQELMPGTITAEAAGTANLDGKSFEAFRVSTSDLEVDLYLDSAHRLMRLEVPSAKVSVIRD